MWQGLAEPPTAADAGLPKLETSNWPPLLRWGEDVGASRLQYPRQNKTVQPWLF